METEVFVVWLLICVTGLVMGIDFVLRTLLCVLVLVAIDLVKALTLRLRVHAVGTETTSVTVDSEQ